MPPATMADTASPAASSEWNAASCVVTASGRPDDAQGDLRGDPERSLRADEQPEQVAAVGVERLPAELEQLAVGQHDPEPGDVVDGEAVLQAVRAAGVLGHVAADRAHLLARRVRRVEEAVRRDSARDVEVRDTGLDDDALGRQVELEDAVHARDRDHDPLRHRQRSARQSCARTARDERQPLAVAEAHDRLHLLRRAREHDARRQSRASP